MYIHIYVLRMFCTPPAPSNTTDIHPLLLLGCRLVRRIVDSPFSQSGQSNSRNDKFADKQNNHDDDIFTYLTSYRSVVSSVWWSNIVGMFGWLFVGRIVCDTFGCSVNFSLFGETEYLTYLPPTLFFLFCFSLLRNNIDNRNEWVSKLYFLFLPFWSKAIYNTKWNNSIVIMIKRLDWGYCRNTELCWSSQFR